MARNVGSSTSPRTLQKTISGDAVGAKGAIFENDGSNEERDGCETCFKVYKQLYRNKMRHEFETIRRLNVEGVHGVPRAFNCEEVIVNRRVHTAIKMEKFNGPDLHVYINQRIASGGIAYDPKTKTMEPFFTEDEIFHDLGVQLMDILKNIHLVGAHRDIKLENLILSQDGNKMALKLIDFDSFVYNEDRMCTDSKRMRGTVVYASPEELRQESEGQPSDIWAVGICFLVLLGQMDIINHSPKTASGKSLPFFTPYYIATTDGHINSMIEERIRRLDISEPHKELLRNMLAADPGQRPDAWQLYHRLLPPTVVFTPQRPRRSAGAMTEVSP